jgi:glycosyltransferase involved in cell wall biosynthesis
MSEDSLIASKISPSSRRVVLLPQPVRAGPPRIEVLLSTFDGAPWIAEQSRSILAQTLRPVRIRARDDGSTDDTPRLLTEALDGHFLAVMESGHLGATQSYFELLRSADPDCDFYAFADQDDVWHADKLTRAIAQLQSSAAPEMPALYCSRVEIVDEKLRPLGLTPIAPYHPSLANALVQNIAMGCTVVLNRPARDMLLQHEPPPDVFHDWWCYLVVSAFGTVLFDPSPSLLYRQHQRNHVGASATVLGRLLLKIRRQFDPRRISLCEQASAFLDRFGSELEPHHRDLLSEFVKPRVSRIDRARYAFHAPLYRQNRFDTLAMRILYVLNHRF